MYKGGYTQADVNAMTLDELFRRVRRLHDQLKGEADAIKEAREKAKKKAGSGRPARVPRRR